MIIIKNTAVVNFRMLSFFFTFTRKKSYIHVKFLDELPYIFGSHVDIVRNGQILHACELFMQNKCEHLLETVKTPSLSNNTPHTVTCLPLKGQLLKTYENT